MSDDYTTIKQLLAKLHKMLDDSQATIDALHEDIQTAQELEESARKRIAQLRDEYEKKSRKH